jgi:hypothetical protein
MNIKIMLRNTFGTARLIPACDVSKAMTKLTNTQTLTEAHAKVIQAIGFKVRVVHADLGCEKLARRIEKGNK